MIVPRITSSISNVVRFTRPALLFVASVSLLWWER